MVMSSQYSYSYDFKGKFTKPLKQVMETLRDEGLEEGDWELLARIVQDFLEKRMEREDLRSQLVSLQAELAEAKRVVTELNNLTNKLREEKTYLEAERDQYIRSLQALIPKTPVTFTEKEVKDLMENGVTFDQILEDLKSIQGA